MEISNIFVGENVIIDETSSVNNVKIGNNVKISKYCSVYGSKRNILVIGDNSYIGMFTIINGYSDLITIGNNVSIAQNVNIMADSGPNASPSLQRVFEIVHGSVTIEEGCWIGAGAIIMPNVHIGKYSVVGANCFLDRSFDEFSIIGGTPARLIRRMSEDETNLILEK